MADADPFAGAASSIVQAAHDFGLWNAVGSAALLIALWKSPDIIRAIGEVVKDWRETTLKIREFDRHKAGRVETIAQDVRDEQARLHISSEGAEN